MANGGNCQARSIAYSYFLQLNAAVPKMAADSNGIKMCPWSVALPSHEVYNRNPYE